MRAALLLVLFLPALAPAQAKVDRSEVAALLRQGYQFHAGRWRLPTEIAYLQRAAAKRDAAPAAAAAQPAGSPAAKVAPKPVSPDRLRPAQPKRPRTTGLFSIRLQQVQLLGIDTVPVSFGNGQGRLQLPRTQTVSIGTTVSLPIR